MKLGDYQRHYTGGRGRVLDEQLCGTFYPANDSAGVPMSEADFEKGIAAELQPGRFLRVVGGETLVRTHGTADARREELRKKRDEGKEREQLRADEGRFKYARLEQERELGELLERRIERGFEGLSEPDQEEIALLADGGRERALRLMREASAVGARAWLMPDGGEVTRAARATGDADERADDGGVGAAPTHMDGDFDEMIVDDAAAPLPQATHSCMARRMRTTRRSLRSTRRCAVRPFGRQLSNTAGRRLAMMLRAMTMRRCDGAAGLTR